MKILSVVFCLTVLLALFTSTTASQFPKPLRNSCRGNCYYNVHSECVRPCIQTDYSAYIRKCSKVMHDCYAACPETRKIPRV